MIDRKSQPAILITLVFLIKEALIFTEQIWVEIWYFMMLGINKLLFPRAKVIKSEQNMIIYDKI